MKTYGMVLLLPVVFAAVRLAALAVAGEGPASPAMAIAQLAHAVLGVAMALIFWAIEHMPGTY